MKALYALAFVCLSVPALAGSPNAQTAAVDPATIWHEFDYDLKDGVKVAKTYPSTFELALDLANEIARTAASDPAAIWHEFDYDLKDGVKVAKTYPSTFELALDLANEIRIAEIYSDTAWPEFDYEVTASIPAPEQEIVMAGRELDDDLTAAVWHELDYDFGVTASIATAGALPNE